MKLCMEDEGCDAFRSDNLTIYWGVGEGGVSHQLCVTRSGGKFKVLLDDEETDQRFPAVMFRKSLDWKRLMQVDESAAAKKLAMHQLRCFVGDDKLCYKLFGILPEHPGALMPFLIQ